MTNQANADAHPQGDGHKGQRLKRLGYAIIIATAIVVVAKNAYDFSRSKKLGDGGKSSKRNQLAIGSATKVHSALDIAIAPPAEFDFKARQDILDMRKEAVARHPELIMGQYEPSVSVFGKISDGASWWGIAGEYFHDTGKRSIEGASEESRFILNPFLLVAADFLGLSIWTQGDLKWDKKRITEEDLRQPDFPFYCEPKSLKWRPAERVAEVVYDVTGYMAAVNQWTLEPLTMDSAYFSLIAYNARDLGFDHIHLSLSDSVNISKPNPAPNPCAIAQYVHRGGSSGYPGGSNNMSPFVPQISDFKIDELPAKAVVHLWRGNPNLADATPDMTVVIFLR